MGLPHGELATLTCPDDLCGVCHGGRLVESLSEGVPYQHSRHCVMAASPRHYKKSVAF